MGEQKKQFQFPATCALLFMLIIFAAVLTWILPAGAFETEKIGNTTRVIAGTYHHIEQSAQGPWDVLMAVFSGFQKSTSIMFMVFFVGAGVHIFQKSGTIDVAFRKIASGGKTANDTVIIFAIMLFMSIGGACGVFSSPCVAMVPIGILLSKVIGLDAAAGMMIVYLGAYSGFNVGWAVPATLGVAHPIAELPVFSGMSVRFVLHGINFVLTYVFIMKYVKSIRKDYTKSLNYEPGLKKSQVLGTGENAEFSGMDAKMELHHVIALITMIISIAAILIGAVKFRWGNHQFATVFLLASIIIGLTSGMGINGTTQEFLNGCKSVVSAAFIIGFANGISVILADGRILDTIVYGLSLPITKMGPVPGACFMYVANLFINLFIPSGSGQAAAVMPLMVPVADLAGISRQVAVQAFQFGDGLSNCIVPTAGTLMGCIGIAGVSYGKYAKWFIPLLIAQSIMAIGALIILQSIGWTGL